MQGSSSELQLSIHKRASMPLQQILRFLQLWIRVGLTVHLGQGGQNPVRKSITSGPGNLVRANPSCFRPQLVLLIVSGKARRMSQVVTAMLNDVDTAPVGKIYRSDCSIVDEVKSEAEEE